MITKERIQERINRLEAERAALVEQANQQIAALNGALAALRQLLEEDAPAANLPPVHSNGAAIVEALEE